MVATLAASEVIETEADQCIVLQAVSWRQYETLLQTFPEQAGLRIWYIDGRLTLLSPTYRHDRSELAMGFLVVALASAYEIECEPAGHTTYRREGLGAGVEGDATFYLRENARRMREAQSVDLTTQPPPDLAVGVEATHPADDAVAVWGRIKVPEVWRLNTKRGTLTFGLRQDDGSYAPSPRSAAFPELEPADILARLPLIKQLGFVAWCAQLDGWVRGTILPRRGARARKKAPKKGGPKR